MVLPEDVWRDSEGCTIEGVGIRFPQRGGSFSPKIYEYKFNAKKYPNIHAGERVGDWVIVDAVGEEKVVKVVSLVRSLQNPNSKGVERMATSSEIATTRTRYGMYFPT